MLSPYDSLDDDSASSVYGPLFEDLLIDHANFDPTDIDDANKEVQSPCTPPGQVELRRRQREWAFGTTSLAPTYKRTITPKDVVLPHL